MLFMPIINQCKEELIKEGKGHSLTGEKYLNITRLQLIEKLNTLDLRYTKTMELEKNVFISNGLIDTNGEEVFIPDWDLYIVQLYSFTKERID